ncbi:unnamed protein product, partial [Rotaria sp. Silwood2]
MIFFITTSVVGIEAGIMKITLPKEKRSNVIGILIHEASNENMACADISTLPSSKYSKELSFSTSLLDIVFKSAHILGPAFSIIDNDAPICRINIFIKQITICFIPGIYCKFSFVTKWKPRFETSTTSVASNTPEISNRPEVPNTPEVSNTPEVPNTPEISNTSEVPNTPQISNTPVASNTTIASTTPMASNTTAGATTECSLQQIQNYLLKVVDQNKEIYD